MDAVSAESTTAAEQIGSAGPARGGPRVVVGVDGSSGARTALVLALTEAARRGAVLDVVAAFPVTLVWTGGVPLEIPDVAAVRADTERRARELVEEVRDDEGLVADPGVAGVDIRVVAAEGRPVPALLRAAESADLLVVGSRGRGAVRSVLLGSVALHCLSHAPCPVLIAHGGEPVGQTPRVVVGTDGSDSARAAVVAAVGEAARSGAELEVVACYSLADYWTDLGTVLIPAVDAIRADVRRHSEELVDGILAERGAADVVPTVRTQVVEGAAGDVLVQRSRGANLLVVGSSGHGAVRGLVLGSVALHCTLHSAAPVLVVRPRRARSGTDEPQRERVLATG